MARTRQYKKGKISRIVRNVQVSIRKKQEPDIVIFEEWYFTISDNQLILNMPYIIVPSKSEDPLARSIHFETL